MNSPRPTLVSELPLPVVSGLTTWLALFAWGGFIDVSSVFLVPVLLGMACVVLAGVVARQVRFPWYVVATLQALVIMLFVNAFWGSSALPTPASVETTVRAFRDSVDILGKYAAPVPGQFTEVAPVLVLGGLGCHLLVDLCAVTLRRVPLAGLPLLIIYTLPIGILDRSVNPIVFTLTVIGFLMMLALQEGHRIARWGRQFGAPAGADGPGPFGAVDARRHPAAIGAGAVVLAVILPIFIPTLDLHPFDGGGHGPGAGDREVRITNPMTDLHRDLARGADIGLVTVNTKADEPPSYLRTTVLTTYTGEAWTPGNRDLPSDNSANGEMPSPLALDIPRTLDRWKVSISEDLDSLWLPTPIYVASVSGADDWRFDDETLDVHGAHNDVSTKGMDYSLQEIVPDIGAERLAESTPPPVDITSKYLALPDNLPERVEQITGEVTVDAENDYEIASALQTWFRSGGGFEYTLERSAGNGNDALLEFLEKGGRRGYCEQFASAMAVMARSAGVPARVAVGFFNSEKVGANRYEFSSHDLHAWPELYFEGTGWVRFEPTPASHIPSVPSYSDESVNENGPDPTNDPSQSQDSTSSSRPSLSPSPTTPAEKRRAAQGTQGDGGFPWGTLVWLLGGLLLVAVLLLSPRVVRRNRTRRRHASEQPLEAAWAEMADSAVDLDVAWPPGLSPRATGTILARSFAAPRSANSPERPQTGPGTNPEAMSALIALVGSLEESRYAPTAPRVDGDVVWRDVETCVEAWRGGLTPRARFRAEWWPRSVTGRRQRNAGARSSTPADDEDAGSAVDHIG